MYGLVNKAMEDMVCSRYGEDTWSRILQRAGMEEDAFISAYPYPDSLTYDLISAASDILEVPPVPLLEAFGQYWVLYTGSTSYGPLLKMHGDTLFAFLTNLDNLHARVGTMLTELQPPSFRCTEVTLTSLRLHYHSQRVGLAPMVVGMVAGLGILFETQVGVTRGRCREEGADHDEFLVTLL